jgi:hypothetical protein
MLNPISIIYRIKEKIKQKINDFVDRQLIEDEQNYEK